MSRRLVASGHIAGDMTTMTVAHDLYQHGAAHALPSLPGEHAESISVDMTTRDGQRVDIRGRATVFAPTRVIFVDVPTECSALDRYAASALLQHAIRQGLVGSDTVRAAVGLGYTVRGIERTDGAS